MTDRIEKMLSIALQDANKALGEARRSVRVIEADANEIERLLSLHLQSKQVEAETTQAWDPALVVNGSAPNRTVPDRSAPFHCSRCGVPLHQRGNSWVGGDDVEYCEGEQGGRHIAVSANGGRVDQMPTSVRLPATPAQPSPPPADQPTPPGRPLHEADPVRRVDLSEAQGGAS